MNKQEIVIKFKGINRIKRTIHTHQTNQELKKDILNLMVDNDISKDKLKETETRFSLGCHVWIKTRHDKINIITKLNSDIKGKNIIEYDKIYGNWIKTNYALYEIIKE